MRGMKISFVIPAYNEERFIGNCLRSVLERITQAGTDNEIIIVNNASTDKTKEIAAAFPGVLVVDEPRKGLSRARQAGYQASSGDLIANIDADSMLPPGWIQTVVAQFSDNPDLVALSGPQVFYDVPPAVRYWTRVFYGVSFCAYVFNRFILRTASFLQGGNFVIRRSALNTIGGYNTNFEFYGEDADIARRLHKIGDVEFTFKLPIYASGRRVMTEGKFTMAWRYGINYVWTILLHRPFTKTVVDVRVTGKQKV